MRGWIRSVLTVTSLLVGGGFIQTAMTSSPAGASGMVWGLQNDFRVAPNEMNPSPDRYGEPGVWSYLYSSSEAHDPSTYTLMPTFQNPDQYGIDRLSDWNGSMCAGSSACFPYIAINRTGMTQTLDGGAIVWPAGAVLIHPWTTSMAIVGWTSPVNGTVRMKGSFDLVQTPNCGNGVQWSIDSGATILKEGRITPARTNHNFTLTATVVFGQTFYLTINSNKENYVCDSTLTKWRIVAR